MSAVQESVSSIRTVDMRVFAEVATPFFPFDSHRVFFRLASHLIADHLSWFHDQSKTVEQLVKEKGGRVRRGNMLAADGQDQGETMEILSDTEAEQAGGSDGGFKGS